MSAGLELCRLPPELGSIASVRIGIAHGQAYTGIYGGSARRTYGVQGDKVNLAARLMEHAAPWVICCDTEVYRRAQQRWSFTDLPPVRIKGLVEPVFDLDDQPTSELRLARVAETIERAAPASAPRLALLNDLLHLGAPDSPLIAALDPPLRQESLMQLVGELLRARGRARPLLLLFEDA